MIERKNSFFREIVTHICRIRQYFNYNAILGVLVGLIFSVCAFYVNMQKNVTYIVKVNGNQIGYVNSRNIYNTALDSIRKTDGEEPLKFITLEKAKSQSKDFVTSYQIEKEARHELKLKMPAVAIFANGIEVAKIESSEDVNKVIDEVKKYYYPKIQGGTVSVVSSNIKEKITTEKTFADPDEVLDVNDAAQKIINGRGAEKVYTVKQGDTIWDIALKNDISIEDIQIANPKLNINKIGIGNKIKLKENVPFVNVDIVADVTSNEQLPYDTKILSDKKLSKGVKKVQQCGKNGVVQVKKHLVIANDDVVSEEVLESHVLSAAVNEIIVEGSKVPEYVASGEFITPSRGSLTSRFGRRWGRMHEGIDLAAPTGTPIYAADSGKISFAGRRSGYGLCVMINHGNGLQTLYGHTSKVFVKPGQSVKKGQRIALVGSTGRSTGPHLHFEVRKNGSPRNPLSYIR